MTLFWVISHGMTHMSVRRFFHRTLWRYDLPGLSTQYPPISLRTAVARRCGPPRGVNTAAAAVTAAARLPRLAGAGDGKLAASAGVAGDADSSIDRAGVAPRRPDRPPPPPPAH